MQVETIERTANADIASWRRTKTHQALLVDGARQVGKTALVREFAREYYGTYIEINFLESPFAMEVVSQARDTRDLMLRIMALSDARLVPGDTLVFFDEVQEFGGIVTWAKSIEKAVPCHESAG